MAMLGAGPSRMRGVCCENATARNGERARIAFGARSFGGEVAVEPAVAASL